MYSRASSTKSISLNDGKFFSGLRTSRRRRGSRSRRFPFANKGQLCKLFRKRALYKIFIDEVDVTPLTLVHPSFALVDDSGVNAIEFIAGVTASNTAMPHQITSSIFLQREPNRTEVSVMQSISQSTFLLSDVGEEMLQSMELSAKLEEVPTEQHFRISIATEPPFDPDRKVVITLAETPTFFLLDRPSQIALPDTEEAGRVQHDNEYYGDILTGKSGKKKTTSTEMQTITNIQKPALTNTLPVTWHTVGTFCSYYDIYTALERSKKRIETVKKTTVVSRRCPRISEEYLLHLEEEEETKEDEALTLFSKESFKNAVSIMERILASNIFNERQKIFKVISAPDPFRADRKIKYSLVLLWTFSCDLLRGFAVSSMSWNKENSDILAVGYRSGYYTPQPCGIVCIWCIKNPAQPERTYSFKSPVTSVDFSSDHPNLLVVALYNGVFNVLDVSSRETNIVAYEADASYISHVPIWSIMWFRGDACENFEEQIIATCENGLIFRSSYGKGYLKRVQMMRIQKIEGSLKGIPQERRCTAYQIPVRCYPSALLLAFHPSDRSTYFVCSEEGGVYRCSTDYLRHHRDVFQAHTGPVYGLQFSPFCNRIFATCGADWCARIWADGVHEPLLVLEMGAEVVQATAWSPANSTILATAAGAEVQLWDIRRKSHAPTSAAECPAPCTTLLFSPTGADLLAGDAAGAVHVFGLADMPFAPFFQAEALADALRRPLITKPRLLDELAKLGPPF